MKKKNRSETKGNQHISLHIVVDGKLHIRFDRDSFHYTSSADLTLFLFILTRSLTPCSQRSWVGRNPNIAHPITNDARHPWAQRSRPFQVGIWRLSCIETNLAKPYLLRSLSSPGSFASSSRVCPNWVCVQSVRSRRS